MKSFFDSSQTANLICVYVYQILSPLVKNNLSASGGGKEALFARVAGYRQLNGESPVRLSSGGRMFCVHTKGAYAGSHQHRPHIEASL